MGRELEVIAHVRVWGDSLGVVIPKRTVERLSIRRGDEVRLLVRRQKDIASMPASRSASV